VEVLTLGFSHSQFLRVESQHVFLVGIPTVFPEIALRESGLVPT
jgi:hypothetical protein